MDRLIQVLVITIIVSLHFSTGLAVTRRTRVGSPLHLECRDNQTIKINDVILGKDSCLYSLRRDHSDYIRVVTECSGLKSCSNIILRESTRIPCTNIGVVESHFMDVNYNCVADYNKMDICHNTVRTTSPFTGYLSSPSYPHIPADSSQREVSTSESVEVVCQCEIEAMSASAQIELTLIDMYNSEQIELSDPGGNTRYLCDDSDTGRCINDVYVSEYSAVNITYRPHHDRMENTKFMLQYSAVDSRSRVRSVCSVLYISLALPHLSTTESDGRRKETNIDITQEEDLGVETIIAISVGAIMLCVLIVLVAVLCRRRYIIRSRNCNQTVFKIFAADGNPTYDMVPDDNHYASIHLKNSKGVYDHVYHEPGDPSYEREYSEPCTDMSGAEYKVDSDQNTLPLKGGGIESNQVYMSGGTSDSGAIYESLEHLREDQPQRPSRLSRMKKSSSMPQHPAPPIPRNALQKLNSRLDPSSTRKDSKSTANNKSASQSGAEDDAKQNIQDKTGAAQSSHYDVPKAHYHHLYKSGEGTASSRDSMPDLDLDMGCDDIITETNRILQMLPSADKTRSSGVSDTEYMMPIKVEERLHGTKASCKLVDNELYEPEN